jgi:hypothetical protein
MARLQATLGPITFGAVDNQGVDWRLRADDGLLGWDSPEVRTQITQREADHGAWLGPVYLGERPVTLAGTMAAPDQATLEDAMERLRAAASLTDTVLTVWESIPKQAVVRRSGKPLTAYSTDRVGTFSVMVTAGDPRRYGVNQQQVTLYLPSSTGGLVFPVVFPIEFDAITTSGDAVLPNAGNIGSLPLITVYGPVTEPSLVLSAPNGSTATLTYGDTIAAGDWLDLDCDHHTALYNSQSSRRGLLSGPWPQIPPGGVNVSFRAGSYDPAARALITYRDAWM